MLILLSLVLVGVIALTFEFIRREYPGMILLMVGAGAVVVIDIAQLTAIPNRILVLFVALACGLSCVSATFYWDKKGDAGLAVLAALSSVMVFGLGLILALTAF